MDKDLLAEGYRAMAEAEQLSEDIKSCRNLCSIILILLEQGRGDLLATPIELLFLQVQELTDENCTVQE